MYAINNYFCNRNFTFMLGAIQIIFTFFPTQNSSSNTIVAPAAIHQPARDSSVFDFFSEWISISPSPFTLYLSPLPFF